MNKIIFGLLIVFVLLQFIPIDRTTPEFVANQDFIINMQPPVHIAAMIKDACYDCHSYQTKYPWYSLVAPASWWLQGHINEGREHLNFSTWVINSEKEELMEECAEEILEGEMPLHSYTWMGLHPKARFTKVQRQQLVAWFNQNREGEKNNNYQKKKERNNDDD